MGSGRGGGYGDGCSWHSGCVGQVLLLPQATVGGCVMRGPETLAAGTPPPPRPLPPLLELDGDATLGQSAPPPPTGEPGNPYLTPPPCAWRDKLPWYYGNAMHAVRNFGCQQMLAP